MSKKPLHTNLHTKNENSLVSVESHYPELQRIVKVWPDLSEHIKAAIIALVDTQKV